MILLLPVFVTVSDRFCFTPTGTLPKSSWVGVDPSAPGVTPVPDRAIIIVESDASESMVTMPVALPAVCGEKEMVKVVLCDAPSVAGVLIPLT